MTAAPTVDPVTFSIIRHRLFRVVEEAVITLKHVSGSAITNEGHDLMVSLYQADGSLLMGGVGFLHHLTSAAEACKAIIRKFEDRIGEGDLFLLNDPYTAALHTSDIYIVSPIHHAGKLVAWSADTTSGALADRYSELRATQQALLRQVGFGSGDWRSAAIVRNVTEFWPGWHRFCRTGSSLPPWPADDLRQQFTWMVTHPDAEVWVPTPTALDEFIETAAPPRDR